MSKVKTLTDSDEDTVKLERQLDAGKLTISWPRRAETADPADTTSECAQISISFMLETRTDDYHMKLDLAEIVKLHRMLTVEPTLIYDAARSFAGREVKISDKVATIVLPLKVGSKVAPIEIKLVAKSSEIRTPDDKNAFEILLLRKRVEELERVVRELLDPSATKNRGPVKLSDLNTARVGGFAV